MKKILKYGAVALAGLLATAAIGVCLLFPVIPQYYLHKAMYAFREPVPPAKDPARIEAYNFVPGSRLEDRINVMPECLLIHLRNWDKADYYEPYLPAPAEKALLMEYYGLLPDAYKEVFKERCVGIFFVNKMKGNGVTSWAVGPDGKVFFHIILNPALFGEDLSATLSARERSCFVPREKAGVTVDAGRKYKGLLYGLFHEATHGLDYVKGITPWTDNDMPVSLRPQKGREANHFSFFWEDFYKPKAAEDFLLREKITFYGFDGGPKLSFIEAPLLYTWLGDSPFASLYGSMSWTEDFAELATFHLITKQLGQPYKITLTGAGEPRVLEPMRSKKVSLRAEVLMFELYASSERAKIATSMKEAAKLQDEADDLLQKAEALLNAGK